MDAVGICNMALGWIGAAKIAALDELAATSTEEELCARLYPEAVRSVLEARAWTFATQRLELAPAEATGLADFPSRYPIPTEAIRVLACDTGEGTNLVEWRREGAYVLAESSPATLYARAIVLEEDVSKFSPGFVRAVAARLAADLAVSLSENVGLAQAMETKAQRELVAAGRLDGQQGTSESVRSDGPAARARW